MLKSWTAALLLLVSISGFASSSDRAKAMAALEPQAPAWGHLQMMTAEQLSQMPADDVEKYIHAVRMFLIEEENKQTSYDVGMQIAPLDYFSNLFFDEAFAADQAQASCVDKSKLNPAQAKLVDRVGDKCVIGGYMVCMTFTANGHLRCSPADAEYRKKSAAACKNKDDSLCLSPIFMTASGGPVCVSGKGPVTTKCLNSKDTADEKKITAMLKASPDKYKKDYDKMKADLEGYCGKGAAKQYKFDVKDCDDLNKRLAAIDGVQKQNAGAVCQAKVKKDGKEQTITLNRNAESKFVISSTATDGWKVGNCDENGELSGSKFAKAEPAKEPFASCLYLPGKEYPPPLGLESLMQFDSVPSCNLKVSRFIKSPIKKGKCEASIAPGRTISSDGKTVSVSSAQPAFQRLVPKTGNDIYFLTDKKSSDQLSLVYSTDGAGNCLVSVTESVTPTALPSAVIKTPPAKPGAVAH